MTATTTWTISQLDRTLPEGGVVTAHWRVTSVDGDFSATVYSTATFTPDPASPNFKPYDQLTEADVLAWVWKQVDKDAAEANLAAQIDAQKNPTTASGLPW